MKNYAKLIKLTLLVVSSTIMFSCSDDDSTTQDRTITEFISKNPTLTNLYAALEKAELSETLNQSGQFTIFAPTNEAFAEFLAVNGFENLEDVPTPVLKEILLNHVLNARVPSSDVSTGSTRKRIGLSDLKQLPIKAPCLEEQTKIANFLSAIDQKIEVVAQQIEQAKQWKKGLLQQMFV